LKLIKPEIFFEFGSLEFLARQVVEGFITGRHKSPFHGFSVEFAEHRIYNPGESTRHVDWKLYAKTDKLFSKKYEEETNLRCQIVMDVSGSMYYPIRNKWSKEQPNKYLYSCFAAASLINLFQRQRDAVGLSMFSEDILVHTPAKGLTKHIHRLYQELENHLLNFKVEDYKQTKLASALDIIAENIHKRSLVIIFSDLLFKSKEEEEEFFSALQHLRFNKHEVLLFHVLDQDKELDFNFKNEALKLIDLESGEEMKLRPKELQKGYADKMKKLQQEIAIRCGQNKIDYQLIDINDSLEKVLWAYLAKRNQVKQL